jgi:hypothetical protein
LEPAQGFAADQVEVILWNGSGGPDMAAALAALTAMTNRNAARVRHLERNATAEAGAVMYLPVFHAAEPATGLNRPASEEYSSSGKKK